MVLHGGSLHIVPLSAFLACKRCHPCLLCKLLARKAGKGQPKKGGMEKGVEGGSREGKYTELGPRSRTPSTRHQPTPCRRKEEIIESHQSAGVRARW